jgi:hypothetical protein
MVRAKVSIRGVRPLLLNHFGPDALPLEKQEKDGVAGNSPNEWRKTALVTKEGQLYLKPTYAFASIRDAAKHTPKGRSTMQSSVAATLQIVDDRILLDRFMPGFPNGHAFDIAAVEPPPTDPDAFVYLDVQGVRNPNTMSRNIRYRLAACSGWACSFTIFFDKTVVDRNQMRAILRDAGVLVGIADGRSVGFGRFEVVKFEESKS